MKKLIFLLCISVFFVGCKQRPTEVQIADIDAQKALKMEELRHQQTLHQMTLDNEREMARERGLHEREMERKNNKFWEFIATVFGVLVSVLGVIGATIYTCRQFLIKQVREREIVQEYQASIEKYKIAIEQLQIMLPQLSKEERKLLFENGGLLSKDKRLEYENS